MGTAKLMTPLFYDGNYNAEGKRMRVVLERMVSNGTESYRLWRSDGKPELEYGSSRNQKAIPGVQPFCPLFVAELLQATLFFRRCSR